ncbi:hypothetical protein D3C77_469040 [compost metagenome]
MTTVYSCEFLGVGRAVRCRLAETIDRWSLHAQPLLTPSASGAAIGLAFHSPVSQTGAAGVARLDRDSRHHVVDGPGYTLAGRSGLHDPLTAVAQPIHRFLSVAGAGIGDRDVQSLLSGVVDR